MTYDPSLPITRTAAMALAAAALLLTACSDDPGGSGGEGGSSGTSFLASSSNGAGNGNGQSGAETTGAGVTTGSTTTTDVTTTTSTGSGGDEYQLCVDLINGYRATVGSPPLARWTDAETCSNSEAQSDSETGQPHGAFGQCGEFAQDECPGWSGTNADVITGCLQLMWDEGPGGGHYENMKNTDATYVACGYHTGSDGVWAVQNFK